MAVLQIDVFQEFAGFRQNLAFHIALFKLGIFKAQTEEKSDTYADFPRSRLMLPILEDTARYAGLLLAPAEGFGLRPRLFLALRAKKELFMLFWPIFGDFWCPLVTVVTFSSNLSNFERNQNNFKIQKKKSKKFQKIQKSKKIQKIQKIQKNPKNPKKSKKNPKSP